MEKTMNNKLFQLNHFACLWSVKGSVKIKPVPLPRSKEWMKCVFLMKQRGRLLKTQTHTGDKKVWQRKETPRKSTNNWIQSRSARFEDVTKFYLTVLRYVHIIWNKLRTIFLLGSISSTEDHEETDEDVEQVQKHVECITDVIFFTLCSLVNHSLSIVSNKHAKESKSKIKIHVVQSLMIDREGVKNKLISIMRVSFVWKCQNGSTLRSAKFVTPKSGRKTPAKPTENVKSRRAKRGPVQ